MKYIVVWDDQQGMACPMGWDADCENAICSYSDHVAVFSSREHAFKAIRISKAFARLKIEQGILRKDGSDFIGHSAKNLRVVPLNSGSIEVNP